MQRPNARSRLKVESDMDPPIDQTRPGQRSSPSSTSIVVKPKSKPSKSMIFLIIVASLAVVLGLFFVCYSIIRSGKNHRRSSLRYSVVIDGGSSGTRAHVFGYKIESGKLVFDFGEESYASLKLSPGLSAYAQNPEGASVSLKELVEFAKGKVPKGMLKEIDIRLMATAGMRMLELSVQEEILEVSRRVLRSSGFKFQDEWTSVISGSDEGLYAWIVANHALGLLGGDPLQTTGIVELGGASAQVTFVSRELVPHEFSRTISYENVSYNLYSHSFLNFGQDAAHEKLSESLHNSAANSTGNGIVSDPCTPKGYFLEKNSPNKTASVHAAGNFSKCRAATFTMLQEGKEKCSYKHCSIGSTFTPNLQGRFLATENFFHTSKFFGLREKDWLSEMILAGKRFCGEDWSKLKAKYPTFKDENLLRICFSSAYIVSMLHDTFGVALDDERIEFAVKAGEENIPLDWALGAFILNTATATSDYNGLRIMEPEMDPLKVQILPVYTVTKPKSKSKKSIILLNLVSLVITLGLLYLLYSIFISKGTSSVRYSVIIDAGSSGTRAHVFRYSIESGKPVYDFGEESYSNLKLTPGLSSYAENPEGASASIEELVKFAKGIVPEGLWKQSDIRLMATAGMRLLEVPVQEEILDVTRRVLRSSGFVFRDEWATVISGSDEGAYAWVVANHAIGSLGGDPLRTTGIVELGGASAQVTFVSSENVPPKYSRKISYGNVTYNIYSHSFLNFGQDAALEHLRESLKNSAKSSKDGVVTDPCTPKGYILDPNSLQAAGNFSQCRSATLAMLKEGNENCLYKHCAIGSTFTPELQGSFLATENFYYTSEFFGLEEKNWLSEMIPTGKSFCSQEWSEIKKKYPTTDERYLSRYCFSSAYIISMLHDSFGVALDDERFEYANKAGEEKISLDWALGAFIINTATATSDQGGKSRKMFGFSNVAIYKLS